MQDINEIIANYSNIVFFGGAGVSTESGIPDFRSQDGLYNQKYSISPEEIVSHSYFLNHTAEFFKFYFDKMVYLNAKPNSAHVKLFELEKIGKLKAVITQNIDGLHQMAGSKNVIELHGSIHRNYCMNCNKFFNLQDAMKMRDINGIPRCECGDIIKPDVVLYEEALQEENIENAVKSLSLADLVIVGGTSLSVYPAAGLLSYAKGDIMLVNKTPSPIDKKAKYAFYEPIGELFSKIII